MRPLGFRHFSKVVLLAAGMFCISVSGRAQITGSTPVTNATVTLWTSGYTTSTVNGTYVGAANVLEPSVTSTNTTPSTFSLPYPAGGCASNQVVYITVSGGSGGSGTNNGILLMAVLGFPTNSTCAGLPTSGITVNEVTTVASAYAFSSFLSLGSASSGTVNNAVNIAAPAGNSSTSATNDVASGTVATASGLEHAYLNAINLACVTTLTTGCSTSGTANTAPLTNSSAVAPAAVVNTIANILQYCVQTHDSSPGVLSTTCTNLFSYAPSQTGATPTTTLGAVLNLARNPWPGATYMSDLWSYSSHASSPATPDLSAQPNDWTLAIAYPVPPNPVSGVGIPWGLTLDADDNVYVSSPENDPWQPTASSFQTNTSTSSCLFGWSSDGSFRSTVTTAYQGTGEYAGHEGSGPVGTPTWFCSGEQNDDSYDDYFLTALAADNLGNIWISNFGAPGPVSGSPSKTDDIVEVSNQGAWEAQYTVPSQDTNEPNDNDLSLGPVVDQFNNVWFNLLGSPYDGGYIRNIAAFAAGSNETGSTGTALTIGTINPVYTNGCGRGLAFDSQGNVFGAQYDACASDLGVQNTGSQLLILPVTTSPQEANATEYETSPFAEPSASTYMLGSTTTKSETNDGVYGVAIDGFNDAWVTAAGNPNETIGSSGSVGLAECVPGGGTPYTSADTTCATITTAGNEFTSPKYLEADGANVIWIMDSTGVVAYASTLDNNSPYTGQYLSETGGFNPCIPAAGTSPVGCTYPDDAGIPGTAKSAGSYANTSNYIPLTGAKQLAVDSTGSVWWTTPAPTVPITSWSVSSGVATFTTVSNLNILAAGQVVTLSGFTASGSTFLNGQIVTVLSTGLTTSQFEADITGSGTPGSATGTATVQNSNSLIQMIGTGASTWPLLAVQRPGTMPNDSFTSITPQNPTACQVTGVSLVSPPTSLNIGEQEQFTASVTTSGSGTCDESVTWTVVTADGSDNDPGYISTSGLYDTPYPYPASVTVTATSVQNSDVSGSATITLSAYAQGSGVTAPTLSVTYSDSGAAISPLIYGMNGDGLDPTASTTSGNYAINSYYPANISVMRWGGDTAERYNYGNMYGTSTFDGTDYSNHTGLDYFENETGNAAMDWAAPNANSLNSGDYAGYTTFNAMLAINNSMTNTSNPNGVATFGTLPVKGFVAKDSTSCSFPTNLSPGTWNETFSGQTDFVNYGTSPNQYQCGSGVAQDGAEYNYPDDTDCGATTGCNILGDYTDSPTDNPQDYEPALNTSSTITAPSASYTTSPWDSSGVTSTWWEGYWTGQWVGYIKSQFGKANDGGVAIWDLDNEPDLWDSVDRDIHPNPFTYDELTEDDIGAALAAKNADNTVKIAGPVMSEWYYYFYSRLDVTQGEANQYCYQWWSDASDRIANGGIPFATYYAQQMSKASDAYYSNLGVPLLDYFDVHAYGIAKYPASNGDKIYLNYDATHDAADTQVQQERINQVRLLWDTTYNTSSNPDPYNENYPADPFGTGTPTVIGSSNESDCSTLEGESLQEAPHLITRLQSLISAGWDSTNFPTPPPVSISEWNYGGQDNMSGAIAEADALGIYGADGVGMATFFGGNSYLPGVMAFAVYRNYDGSYDGFGNYTMAATSSGGTNSNANGTNNWSVGPGILSIYAAYRSSDQAVTVVVINKTYTPLTQTVTLNSLPTGYTSASAYQYTETNVQNGDNTLSSGATVSFTPASGSNPAYINSYTFPAQSITLFVIPLS